MNHNEPRPEGSGVGKPIALGGLPASFRSRLRFGWNGTPDAKCGKAPEPRPRESGIGETQGLSFRRSRSLPVSARSVVCSCGGDAFAHGFGTG